MASKAYSITRDGFTFLAMGFTGAKAAMFKEKTHTHKRTTTAPCKTFSTFTLYHLKALNRKPLTEPLRASEVSL